MAEYICVLDARLGAFQFKSMTGKPLLFAAGRQQEEKREAVLTEGTNKASNNTEGLKDTSFSWSA